MSIYCILQIIQGEKVSRILRINWWMQKFNTKTFSLSFKMVGHGPGSTLKEFLWFTFRLGEGLWSNATFLELLVHCSNAPDKINIAIQLFPNDLDKYDTHVLTASYFELVHHCTFKSFLVVKLGISHVYRELFMHVSTLSF